MENSTAEVETPQVAAWKRFPPLIHIEGWLSAIETVINYAAVILILFLMFFTTFGVAARYVFNRPFAGHVDVPEMVMAVVVFMALAYTQRTDGHIRIELFVTRVLKGRLYHVVESLTLLLSVAVFVLITVYSFRSALDALAVGDVTPAIYWPTWPAKLCVPVGSFFLCVRFTIQLLQHLAQAVIGVERRYLG
jgi:C4-dicarboxylate transporter DctQ subunit